MIVPGIGVPPGRYKRLRSAQSGRGFLWRDTGETMSTTSLDQLCSARLSPPPLRKNDPPNARGLAVRAVLVLVLLSGLAAACTPYIPVKPGFGTSALTPVGDIPPEYGEFNNYDPEINRLLSTQICATPYQVYEAIDAIPGRLLQSYGRCRNHVPLFGP